MSQAFTLDGTYIHLRPDERASVVEGGEAFWATVDQRRELDKGRLMGIFDQSGDWPHWERHPAGEEILTLLSGEMEMVIETESGEQRTALVPGQTFVVPQGAWHRGIVKKAGQLLFVTPGAGTEHRPVASAGL
jgi:quercetin dioxygenase-like cupin family protein